MEGETPEQIAAHRDQLKEENDRINPALDAANGAVARQTEALRLAQEQLAARDDTIRRQTEQLQQLSDKLARIRAVL